MAHPFNGLMWQRASRGRVFNSSRFDADARSRSSNLKVTPHTSSRSHDVAERERVSSVQTVVNKDNKCEYYDRGQNENQTDHSSLRQGYQVKYDAKNF